MAQINIGTMVAPTDDPRVAEFMDALDRVNAVADAAPGFVWRLQTDSGNATDIQIFPDPLRLVNMSVWESVDALKAYTYGSEHMDFFRRRREWFEPSAKRVALWHVRPGELPQLDDAVRRVEFLERHGPSPYAFGFARPPEPVTFEFVADVDEIAGLAAAGFAVDAASAAVAVRARDASGTVGFGWARVTEHGLAVEEPDVCDEDGAIGLAIVDQLELWISREEGSALKDVAALG